MIVDEKINNSQYLVLKWLDLFLETKNPIYAWRTYQNARRLGLPIPDEVMTYLDGAADRIVKTANNPPPAAKRPMEVARALGLGKKQSGAGSAFGEYADRQNKRKIAMEAFFEVKDGATPYAVFEGIGEKYGNIGSSTVRRYYEEYLNIWERMLKSLIDQGLIEIERTEGDGSPKVNSKMQVAGTIDDMREAAIILSLASDLLK